MVECQRLEDSASGFPASRAGEGSYRVSGETADGTGGICPRRDLLDDTSSGFEEHKDRCLLRS